MTITTSGSERLIRSMVICTPLVFCYVVENITDKFNRNLRNYLDQRLKKLKKNYDKLLFEANNKKRSNKVADTELAVILRSTLSTLPLVLFASSPNNIIKLINIYLLVILKNFILEGEVKTVIRQLISSKRMG
jgi:hypothetical protein